MTTAARYWLIVLSAILVAVGVALVAESINQTQIAAANDTCPQTCVAMVGGAPMTPNELRASAANLRVWAAFAFGSSVMSAGVALLSQTAPVAEPRDTEAREMQLNEGDARRAPAKPPEDPAAGVRVAPSPTGPLATMNCIHCGKALPEDSQFCAKCGQAPRVATCPHCSKPRERDAEWCRFCGLSLPALRA